VVVVERDGQLVAVTTVSNVNLLITSSISCRFVGAAHAARRIARCKLSAANWQRAHDQRTALFRGVQRLFQRFDLIVTPTMTTPAKTVDARARSQLTCMPIARATFIRLT
jgi:Asp-tRNA(Asn)/Glu-tRNA(Gln) amidotransferase A subunit family amidase